MTPDLLLQALAQVAAEDTRKAALFLALPVHVLPGLEVQEDVEYLFWRGVRVEKSVDPIVDAVRLATMARRENDVYFDLKQNPSTWIKEIHSGSQVLFTGLEILFAGPCLLLDVNVPRNVAFDLVEEWLLTRRLPARYQEWHLTPSTLGVQVGPKRLLSAPASMARRMEVGESIARELGGVLSLCENTGSDGSMLYAVDGPFWRAFIPGRISASSEALGTSALNITHAVLDQFPGWDTLGGENGRIVARHQESGLIVYIEPLC